MVDETVKVFELFWMLLTEMALDTALAPNRNLCLKLEMLGITDLA